jgi:putative redox protein
MESNPVIVEDTGQGSYQVRVQAQGPSFLADEPLAMGGMASGPTPYDLLSAALGACTTMTVRLYAQRKAFPLDHVQVSVAHRRDPASGRDIFERTIYLEGELDEAQSMRLLEIAERCPVERTLHHGAEITTRLTPAPRQAIPGYPCDQTHPKAMDQACREVDPTATA